MNLKILKIVTGEELLADVAEVSTNFIKLKNPVRIITIPSKVNPQTPQVAFAPWIGFSDDKEVAVDKSHVIATMTPIKEFVTQYTSMFSGLALPASKLVMP